MAYLCRKNNISMKKLLFLLLFSSLQQLYSQQIIYRNPEDSTQNFYKIFLPKTPIKGLVVIAYDDFVNTTFANEKGIAIASITPKANYIDSMFDDEILSIYDEIIAEICQKHQISKEKVVVGGLSAGGVLAIRYAENCFEKGMKSGIKPMAVFGIDPPLDYERFWNECSRKVKLNFHPAAVAEGKMILDLMNNKFGDSPAKNLQKYHNFAPYSRNATDGGRIKFLKNTPTRMYHEPDVDWWIENRRQDYSAMNSVDCAGAINDLRILGNTKAELIETHNKGYRQDGTRHPHSWSILDEKELIEWCLKLIEK